MGFSCNSPAIDGIYKSQRLARPSQMRSEEIVCQIDCPPRPASGSAFAKRRGSRLIGTDLTLITLWLPLYNLHGKSSSYSFACPWRMCGPPPCMWLAFDRSRPQSSLWPGPPRTVWEIERQTRIVWRMFLRTRRGKMWKHDGAEWSKEAKKMRIKMGTSGK